MCEASESSCEEGCGDAAVEGGGESGHGLGLDLKEVRKEVFMSL